MRDKKHIKAHVVENLRETSSHPSRPYKPVFSLGISLRMAALRNCALMFVMLPFM